jgi:septal ring factor EnvC (AmiA/AmiB activator)
MRRAVKTVVVLFILSGIFIVFGQDTKKLDKTRDQIRQLERDLKAKESKENTLLERVEYIDRKTGLQKKLLLQLGIQKQENERKIIKLAEQLKRTIEIYDKLKQDVARRMVSMYKQGRLTEWEILLSLDSINQLMIYLKYQRKILDNDERNLRILKEKGEEIKRHGAALEDELMKEKLLIKESEAVAAELERQKKNQKLLLAEVRRDKQSIREGIREKRKTYDEIIRQINREVANRKAGTTKIKNSQFASYKGKMSWPVRGKVVSKYGNQLNSVLGIWVRNYGIEIEAAEGEDVCAVVAGKVKWVQWQRGMGNLVLLDHGGRYHTVYGHLDVVFVDIGEDVEEGRVIGRIGDKDSISGSTLDFEVWKGSESYDPEDWLQ